MGGTDWLSTDSALYNDLNDTFDAVYKATTTLTAFWLNDFLYDVYDDFDSYSTGSFTTNTKWNIATSSEAPDANGFADIQTSTINTSGKELKLTSRGEASGGPYEGKVILTSLLLGANKHTFLKIKNTIGQTTESTDAISTIIEVGNTTDGWTIVKQIDNESLSTYQSKGSEFELELKIFAKGDNDYDVYCDLIPTTVNLTTALQIRITNLTDVDSDTILNTTIIDDVRQSKYPVTL